MKGMQRLLKYHPLIQQILKRTDENDTKERAALQEAMDLVLAHGKIVNEEVRRSENRRRLPQIQAALIRESSSIKWVKPQFDLDLTADPQRTLVYEGKLKFVRAQSSLGTVELRTVDMYLFLLSDMILLTTIRTVDDSIKYVVREIKELSPIISMHSITNITTEMTLPERVRTTLCIEIVEAGTEDGSSLHNADDQIRDGPRRGNLSSKKEYLRFVASAQGQLHTWMSHLRKTRQELTETRRDSLVRTQSLSSLASAMEEYSVTMLVSTESKQSTEESTTLSDWEVSWSTSDTSSNNGTQEHVTLTTRSVRLVQGLDGLGFTLIGRSPVEFQEVDVGGSAYIAGVRQGDQIRAINGQECTNAAHHEVVSLIKEAMSKPRPARFIPVNEPIREIEPADMQSIQSLGRTTRSLRKALLTDPNELELAS